MSSVRQQAAQATAVFPHDLEAIDAALRHPRFDVAMVTAARGIVTHHHGQWVLNRVIGDRGRFFLALMILDLHSTQGASGFTAAQLRQAASDHGICSPGRATAFLASLRFLGFLEPVTTADRRIRRLAPTERFLALHRERWQLQFTAVAMVFPDAAPALAAFEQPVFLGAFAAALMAPFRIGVRMVALVPEIAGIVDRDSGLLLLMAIHLAAHDAKPASIASLARRFSVSRAHVLTVVREAETAGLATVERSGVTGTPRLHGAMRRFFALMLIVHVGALKAALQQHQAADAGGRTPPDSEPNPAQ